VEAGTNDEEVERELDRIESAVEGGERDLAGLGFWRLVGRLKRDPPAAARWADRVGRIDATAFEAGVALRVPVWVGTLLLLVLTVIGALLVVVARDARSELLAGVALVLSGAIWSLSVHDLAHWLVGRAVGIRFSASFLAGMPPRPGLKTDYGSYLRADASSRAAMHASGALATKLAPFVALAFWPGTRAPWWAAAALLLLGVVEILTDLLFSVRSSDWKRVRRERTIARELAAAGSPKGPTYTGEGPGSSDGPG